jgi:hypothetical protein
MAGCLRLSLRLRIPKQNIVTLHVSHFLVLSFRLNTKYLPIPQNQKIHRKAMDFVS